MGARNEYRKWLSMQRNNPTDWLDAGIKLSLLSPLLFGFSHTPTAVWIALALFYWKTQGDKK